MGLLDDVEVVRESIIADPELRANFIHQILVIGHRHKYGRSRPDETSSMPKLSHPGLVLPRLYLKRSLKECAALAEDSIECCCHRQRFVLTGKVASN